jgi:hypothetical protein
MAALAWCARCHSHNEPEALATGLPVANASGSLSLPSWPQLSALGGMLLDNPGICVCSATLR